MSSVSGSILLIRPLFPPAISAILSADLIIIGPGSLYSSMLPKSAGQGFSRSRTFQSGASNSSYCNVATETG